VTTALLGILKAGCAFMALDPFYPVERLKTMLGQAPPAAILYEREHKALADKLIPSGEFTALAIPGETPEQPLEPPQIDLRPDDMCYICFTSGSSGVPKAIAGRHQGLTHFIQWEIDTFGLQHGPRVSQLTTPSFDAFFRDVFVPLCTGGTMCAAIDREVIMDPARLAAWIHEQRVEVCHMVPTLFRSLLSQELNGQMFPELKQIMLAGEMLYPDDVRRWRDIFGERVELVNFYGPSETTLIKFFYRIQPGDDERKGPLPVGRPMRGATAVIVDRRNRAVSTGMLGEILIRTPYRSLGYYRRPELTDQVFVPNPFSDDPNDIVYRTGDMGKLLPDDNFLVMGRKDHQVKVRGVRVELSEIETALRAHPAVDDLTVMDRLNSENEVLLCAYFTASREEVSPSELRRFLEASLPPALIPTFFVRLDSLPRTFNGKIDRKALPLPEAMGNKPNRDFTAPRNQIEETLAELVRTTLALEKVGIHDNFQELGAHSLKMIMLLSKVSKTFGVKMPLARMLENPTVAGLAELTASFRKNEDEPASAPAVLDLMTGTQSGNLVQLHAGGQGSPVFVVHPGGGLVQGYADLAMALGEHHPVYGIQQSGLDGGPVDQTVEAMSTRYIGALKQAGHRGPFHLAGWSFGGLVAVDIAHRLLEAGERVASLILLDTPAPVAGYPEGEPEDTRLLAFILAQVRTLTEGKPLEIKTDELAGLPETEQLSFVAGRLAELKLVQSEEQAQKRLADLLTVFKTDWRAGAQYTAPVLQLPITLMKATRPSALTAESMADHPLRGEPNYGWGRYTSLPVITHDIHADHYSMIAKPHVQELVKPWKLYLNPN
ncbi:MAG: amino acid adenylation domain-containing protein, partial [Acidobacteriota bacterium]|nr:amino acid adenylation domain-containing protein [Acidobacteriota bacterium]